MQETPVWFLGQEICWRRDRLPTLVFLGFPCGLAGKESSCNAGDLGSILGLGGSPGEAKGYPVQYSGLENSMDCIVHWITKSQTRLSNFHFLFFPALFGLPRWLSSKESTCQCRRRCRFDPLVRKIPGIENSNPLQYPCVGNPMDRGTCQTTVHGVVKSRTQLSDWAPAFFSTFIKLPPSEKLFGLFWEHWQQVLFFFFLFTVDNVPTYIFSLVKVYS